MALRQLGTIDWFVNCHVNKGDDIYIYLGHKDDPEKYTRAEKLRQLFVEEYPVERIFSLSLDEYCRSGSRGTFCYQLEHRLHDLSSMGDMHIDGYGVYIDILS